MSDQNQSGDLEPQGDEVGSQDEAGAKRPRGVYLLPNLFTTGALFSGFYAVIAGMNGHLQRNMQLAAAGLL